MPSRLIRVKSLLLLLVFLAAGTSLPSLDSLLFHGEAGASQRGRIHLEPAGGCLDHAEHCVLGRTATGAGAIATPIIEVTVEPGDGSAHQLRPTSRCRSYPRGGIPQPRAPPALRIV
ncbi:MAG TPA: hypothetical protein VF252_02910 [Gemmatimonadales bacterium]